MDQDKQLPMYDVFVVTGDEATSWLRIGAAYQEKDGTSLGIRFDNAAARNGRLVLKEYRAGTGSVRRTGDRAASAAGNAFKPNEP